MNLLTARNAIGWRSAQQAGVQLIYFARLLILARLLAPEAFGLLAVATIAVSVLMSLSDLGIVPALVQRAVTDRRQLDAAWTVGLVRAAAITILLAACAPWIASLFEQPNAIGIIQLLAFRPVIESLGSIGVVRLTRQFQFRELALIYVPGALIDAITAVLLAPLWGVWALVAGTLAGTGASAALSFALAPHRPRLVFDFQAVAPLIRFGRWVLGTSIVGLLATSVVQLVISRRLGATELGLYFLATKIAFLPADAMRQIVGSVAFPLYASVQENITATAAAFRSLLVAQVAVLFPIYALMIVLAPSLAEALGPRWADTAPLIRIIGIAAAAGLYADAVLPMLLGRGRPDRVMAIVAIQTATLIALILPLITAFGALGAAAVWLPAYGVAQVVSFAFARREISSPLAGSGVRLLMLLLVAASAGAVATLAQMTAGGIAALTGGILLGVVTTGVLMHLLNRNLDLGIRDLIRPRVAQGTP